MTFLVDPVIHQPPVLVGDTALDTLVHEVERPVERDADAYNSAFEHFVEVAGEWIQHGLPDGFR